ncbi:MAG: methyltransferase [Marinilabiliales bacterium]|nr:MAG: methyltransferase [Marinilabiliales bacterium]
MVNKEIEDYMDEYSSKEDKLLHQLYRETQIKTYYPRMVSGKQQGLFLEMISRMIKPLNILEIGTFTGYSGIQMAKGLQDGGKLVTIDINEEMETFAGKYFKLSGLQDKIDFRIGNALEIIPQLDMKFDLVFIDADKEQYIDYYELAMEKLNTGGFILADNVLWSGKVLHPEKKTSKSNKADKETKGIVAFNKHVKKDKRVEKVIIPIRDGVTIIRKL